MFLHGHFSDVLPTLPTLPVWEPILVSPFAFLVHFDVITTLHLNKPLTAFAAYRAILWGWTMCVDRVTHGKMLLTREKPTAKS